MTRHVSLLADGASPFRGPIWRPGEGRALGGSAGGAPAVATMTAGASASLQGYESEFLGNLFDEPAFGSVTDAATPFGTVETLNSSGGASCVLALSSPVGTPGAIVINGSSRQLTFSFSESGIDFYDFNAGGPFVNGQSYTFEVTA